MIENMSQKTREELLKISNEKRLLKNGKEIATSRALKAQKELWMRAGCPFNNSSHWERNHTVVKIF